MKKLIYKIEKLLFKNSSECKFNLENSQHILIVPGLGGSAWDLFPLVRFLRRNQKSYDVTAIPLGLNSSSLAITTSKTIEYLERNLFNKSKPEKIIIIGHSMGGKIACMLVDEIKRIYPNISYEVITLGSPVGVEKRKYFSWVEDQFLCLFSDAYKQWVTIIQPDSKIIKYTGYYSVDDKIIPSALEKTEHTGTIVELKGFSHMDLISPKKIGPEILKVI
jgi:triacylglycerol esterase/lipase EstA (alpha/beta hydrolase family)